MSSIDPCPICLEELDRDEFREIQKYREAKLQGRTIEKLSGNSLKSLRCGHMFDRSCVKEWLASHSTCPMCRRVVKELPSEFIELFSWSDFITTLSWLCPIRSCMSNRFWRLSVVPEEQNSFSSDWQHNS
jgi:Ring finger domain